jgi:hypothetical protein
MGSRCGSRCACADNESQTSERARVLVPSRIRDPELLTRRGRSRSREPRTRRFGRSLREVPVDRWPRVVRSSRGQPPEVARLLATQGRGEGRRKNVSLKLERWTAAPLRAVPARVSAAGDYPCDRATPKRPSESRVTTRTPGR